MVKDLERMEKPRERIRIPNVSVPALGACNIHEQHTWVLCAAVKAGLVILALRGILLTREEGRESLLSGLRDEGT